MCGQLVVNYTQEDYRNNVCSSLEQDGKDVNVMYCGYLCAYKNELLDPSATFKSNPIAAGYTASNAASRTPYKAYLMCTSIESISAISVSSSFAVGDKRSPSHVRKTC